MSIYSMSSPTYTGVSRQALFDAAMSQPLSLTSTLVEQGKGGALESFGLGTAMRESQVPLPAPSQDAPYGFDPQGLDVPQGISPQDYLQGNWVTPDMIAQKRAEMGALSEDQYKASPYYRKDIPYDPGMTSARAEALASMDDAKKVREFYAQKRPFSSFLGNLAGQALDPINYVPIAGEAVKAAAVARMGNIAGHALVGGIDAAANTAIFGVGTAGVRAQFGDDVSWQATISQIATAALIGHAFGALAGAVGGRVDAARLSDAEQRLATLRTTQEARIALNEGIDAVVRGEDVRLSPNATEPMARVANEIAATPEPQTYYHGGRADLTEFSDAFRRDGTLKDKYDVRGIYVTQNRRLAEQYVGKDGKVHEVQIDAKNPVVLPDPRFPEIDSASLTAKDIEKLKAAGYDSVVNKDRMEVALFDSSQVRHKTQSSNGFTLRRGNHDEMNLPVPKPGIDDRVYAIEQNGGPVAFANIRVAGDTADVRDIYSVTDTRHGLLGPAAVRRILRQFLKENPEVKTLTGERVTGARFGGTDHGFYGEGVPFKMDVSTARPEPRSEGVKQAEASVAKPENTKALAAQFSVDPNTGAFPEEAEVAQLASEGRLTPDDAVTLAQAEADYHTGSAFAEALKSVAGCLL